MLISRIEIEIATVDSKKKKKSKDLSFYRTCNQGSSLHAISLKLLTSLPFRQLLSRSK